MNRTSDCQPIIRHCLYVFVVALMSTIIFLFGSPEVRVNADGVPANLMMNHGFEAYDENELPDDWSSIVFSGTPTVKVDTSIAKAGLASLRISSDNEARANIRQRVQIEGGTPYSLKMWLKLDNVVSNHYGAVLRLQYFDVTNTKIGSDIYLGDRKGTHDWELVEHSLQPPPEATTMLLEQFIWFATGTIWLDEVELTEKPKITSTLKSDHPRLLMTEQHLTDMKVRIANDAVASDIYSQVKRNGDELLLLPVSTYHIPDGLRLLETSQEVLRRIYTLAMLFQLNGDIQYAQRAWEELEAVANFPDWNPRHFLDTAEMTHAFAIGYDWLYDYLDEEQKEVVRDAIVNKGLIPGLSEYQAGTWPNARSNWNIINNAGLAAGALAIGDEPSFQLLSEAILNHGFNSIPTALAPFAPDGGWYEGLSYWDYATRYLMMYLSVLETALGTEGQFAGLPGLGDTGDYPLYMEGPLGLSFNYSDSSPDPHHSPQLLWAADYYNRPEYQWFRGSMSGKPELMLLWYRESAYEGPRKSGLSKDKHFAGINVATIRSAWEDSQAIYAGIKGAYDDLSHKQLDAGEFVLDALGVRWASLLGADNYNLPGYFSMTHQRWTYYRNRAEGSNTIVINPGAGPEQSPARSAKIIDYASKVNEAYAVVDLQPVYAADANKAWRGIKLFDDRRQFLVQDEIELEEPGEIWWFMHTYTNIDEVSADGKWLILRQGDKRLYMEILSDQGEFIVMDAVPLPSSPDPEGQHKNAGAQKIAIHISQTQKLDLSVLMVPLHAWESYPVTTPELTPISEWGQTADAVHYLEEVTINGQPYEPFSSSTMTYHIELPADETVVPVIGVQTLDAASQTIITQATEIPGTTWVEVNDAQSDTSTLYAFHFYNKQAAVGLPIADVSASSHDGNIPDNTLDGNYSTRWSAEGDGQWIQYDMGELELIRSISIAWYKGNERATSFAIEVSSDGANWTPVYSGVSSGRSLAFENVDIGSQLVRYVRIIGHGNTSNMWNSIAEVRILDVVMPEEAKPIRLEQVTISAGTTMMSVGDMMQLDVTGQRSDGTAADLTTSTITYYSDRPDIISITSAGESRAVSDGTARLTVIVQDGWTVKMSSVIVQSTDPNYFYLVPDHDTFVQDGLRAADSFGTNKTIIVKSHPTANSGFNRIGFMQFDLSTLPANLEEEVTLHIYGGVSDNGGTKTTLEFYEVVDDNWNELTMNWNNQPALGLKFAEIEIDDKMSWYTINVTDYVMAEHAGDGKVTFAIKQSGNGLTTLLHSKENETNRPGLAFRKSEL